MTTPRTSFARTRRPVAALLALALLTAASACGDDGTDAQAGGSPADDGAYPVTIEHKFGETEIPSEPERVVSLGYTEQDAIVLFGVQPVAVRYAFGPEDDLFFPWADELAGDADPEVLPRSELNMEQIASLRPDLIMAVTAGLTEDEYGTLSEIAPVVVQPEEYEDFGTPWQVQTTITGTALGQPERAEEVVEDVEAQMAAAAEEHPEFEGVQIALSGPPYEGEYTFNSSSDPRTRFFTDLGFEVPEELDEVAGDEFYGSASRERADLLDTDLLLFQAGSSAERAALESDPVLSALPVVAEGRSMFIEGANYDALQFSSALSLPYLIEHLVPELAEVVG